MVYRVALEQVKLNYPADLPITQKRDAIVAAIKKHQVVVITGDTGSGKSTQIPKMCLEAGRGTRGLVGCTQPRRIAAITLAQRVAEELDEPCGRLVGYKIRFKDKTTRSTRIKYMTDGILLAEGQRDRLFRAYDTLIIDEAHERSLNIDFLLGMLRTILVRRSDLKVIITSATIDPEKFSAAFDDAPIIEVSGRTYPVEVWYRPLKDPAQETIGDTTHIDGAIEALQELKRRGLRGDVLVFMPTESDIRETVARLEELKLRDTLVLPLFGRLAGTDQQRVFKRTVQEKIVVATNVAETSITIPGIRYVIDTGLARISQYNPRSRTQGLPILPISQASADQRKGRCGRVAEGICIRLYSEEDYLTRPRYTPPEIQRSNLAEVILRMLDLRLGDITKFPFLDPPSAAAIKDGYGVLKELAAVDSHRRLTKLGKIMARLPLDPRLARMILQAKKEGAVREVAILCAVLSIQDPRERPMDQEAVADQAHARFRDRRSDFVTLLKIWNAYQDHWRKKGSQNQMRKFCRENYLSYRRMREWLDIHHEIIDIINELGGFTVHEEPAGYEAIHRSIVSGYLSHVGMRKEKNIYVGAKGRQMMIFPGSGLFNKGSDWIVACELVHTSRLFARTVAVVDPRWLEDLGKHLCRYAYLDPHWEKRRGQVVASERVTLYGLKIVSNRKVNYSRINPREAREIFIRNALVEGQLGGKYEFLDHNRNLLKRIEKMENKIRRRELLVDDESLYQFYDKRIPDIADVRSFNKWLKEQGGDSSLHMTEEDLLRSVPDIELLEQFPDFLELGEMRLPVRYEFSPGVESDGMTVRVPVHLLPRLQAEPFEWVVPGLLLEKVIYFMKALPKALRRRLVPIPETARHVLERLRFRHGSFFSELSSCVKDVTGVLVPVEEWKRIRDNDNLPIHLTVRFEVVGEDGRLLGVGRDLDELRTLAVDRYEGLIWKEARHKWERNDIISWDFGELPTRVVLGRDAYGVERVAYPALVSEGGKAAIRLFADPRKAMAASRDGLLLLYQWVFAKELKQWRKEWEFPKELQSAIFFMGDPEQAKRRLHLYILRELFDLHDPLHPDRETFYNKVESLKKSLGMEARCLLDEVFEVIQQRHKTQQEIQVFGDRLRNNPAAQQWMYHIASELNELVPADFLNKYRRDRLRELPRYLKALQIRAQRAYVSTQKDQQKEHLILPHVKRLEQLQAKQTVDPSPERKRFLEEYRWMVEDYKVSVFAPEVGARRRISQKRLDEKWTQWSE